MIFVKQSMGYTLRISGSTLNFGDGKRWGVWVHCWHLWLAMSSPRVVEKSQTEPYLHESGSEWRATQYPSGCDKQKPPPWLEHFVSLRTKNWSWVLLVGATCQQSKGLSPRDPGPCIINRDCLEPFWKWVRNEIHNKRQEQGVRNWEVVRSCWERHCCHSLPVLLFRWPVAFLLSTAAWQLSQGSPCALPPCCLRHYICACRVTYLLLIIL
jgi:hypothetical protein